MLKTAMREHRSEMYLSEDPLNVRVEPHLMQQVVFNLVNNACQAMVDPGTIALETLVGKDGTCELQIRDTGKGIPAEILEHIFEPFFTTKEEGQGTGLGLSMSKIVIEKFGGEILVQSEPGQGATFIVRLPVGRRGKCMKILIVDDEPLVRKSLSRACSAKGHQVFEAVDGSKVSRSGGPRLRNWCFSMF